jgi:hypothetical protein
MAVHESIEAGALMTDALVRARDLLKAPARKDPAWPAVASAAFFAICAFGFATAAILAPPVTIAPPTAPAASTQSAPVAPPPAEPPATTPGLRGPA